VRKLFRLLESMLFVFPLISMTIYLGTFLGRNQVDNQPLWLVDEFSSSNADQPNINWPRFRNTTFDFYADMLLTSATYSEAFFASSEMQQILTYESPIIVCYENLMYSGARVGLQDVSANHLVGAANFETYNNMLIEYEYLRTVTTALYAPGTTNPFHTAFWSSESEFNPMRLIYESLVRLDLEGMRIPSLAESWTIQSDGLTTDIHINLAQDILFHDLHPFTASDVMFTYNYMLVHGFAPFSDDLAEITSIEIISDTEIIIHANFLSYWAVNNLLSAPIFPEHLWVDISDPYTYENPIPIGTGPFIFLSYIVDTVPADGTMDVAGQQLVTGAIPEVGTFWTDGLGEYVIGINYYTGQLPLDYTITINYGTTELTLYGSITQDDIIYEYDYPSNADDVEFKHYVSLPANTEVTFTVDWTTEADLDIFIWPQDLEYYPGFIRLDLERWHDYYRSPHQLKSMTSNLDITPKWHDVLSFDIQVDVDGPYDLTENVLFYRYSPDNQTWSDWLSYAEWFDIQANLHETLNFEAPFGEGYYWFRMNTTDWVGHHLTKDFVSGVDYQDPIANAGDNLIVQQYHSMIFDGTGSSDTVGIAEYIWTFTDGVAITLYGENPVYIWQNEGVFIVTLTVIDYFGHSVSDTLSVEVIYDESPPEITVTGVPSGSVIWVPEMYIIESIDESYIDRTEIYLDGNLILSEEADVVGWEFDPYMVADGLHIIMIVVYDIFGHSEEVYIDLVTDTTAPTIDSPDDISYEGGTLGHYVAWTPFDPHPGSYEILRNGTSITSVLWGGEPIIISIDGLTIGYHNFTVIVEDIFHHTTTDEVWVFVEGNTPIGEDVEVEDPDTGISFTFDDAETAGWTNVTVSDTGPHPPDGFKVLGTFYNITTTVEFDGMIVVTFPYDESSVRGLEKNLMIWHWKETGGWEDVTLWVDEENNIIYGEVSSLSPFAIMEDNAPPITSISDSGTLGTNGWYVSDVEIELTAWDSISEIASISYSFDCESWFEYLGPFTISSEGLTSIYFNSTDVAQNVEVTQFLDIFIDKTTPFTDADIGTPTGLNDWYVSSVTLHLNPSDSISGVGNTFYRVNSGQINLYEGPVEFNDDGFYVVEFWSVDFASNSELVNTISFNTDTTSPEATLTVGTPNYGSNPVHVSTSTLLSLDAEDNLSGIDSIEFRIDINDWVVYTNPFSVADIGSHVIFYRSIDVAGNVESEGALWIMVNASTLTYTGALSGNYSDPVTLEAVLVDIASGQPVSGKTIYFSLGIKVASGITDDNGVAIVTIILSQPSGEVIVTATFNDDGEYLSAFDSQTFTINKESVIATYTGSTVVPTTVDVVTLRATVFDDDDGYWGDLSTIYVTFTIFSIPLDPVNPVLVTGSYQIDITNVNGVGVAVIDIPNLAENSYLIIITLDSTENEYYYSKPSDLVTLTIYEPSGDFVTGGGWIWDSSGGKGNFGFNVKYRKNGLPRGQAIYVFRIGDWDGFLTRMV
jgi:hypothetical protein